MQPVCIDPRKYQHASQLGDPEGLDYQQVLTHRTLSANAYKYTDLIQHLMTSEKAMKLPENESLALFITQCNETSSSMSVAREGNKNTPQVSSCTSAPEPKINSNWSKKPKPMKKPNDLEPLRQKRLGNKVHAYDKTGHEGSEDSG